jgi:hypothetical protein
MKGGRDGGGREGEEEKGERDKERKESKKKQGWMEESKKKKITYFHLFLFLIYFLHQIILLLQIFFVCLSCIFDKY